MKKIITVLLWITFISSSSHAALAYEVTTVIDPATVLGTITFSGNVPASRTFQVTKNPEICGESRALTKVSVKNGKLGGAVVILEGVTRGKAFEEKSFLAHLPGKGEFHYAAGERLSLTIRTQNCNFGPFTGVIARNESIRFSNDDPIKHTLHTYVRRGTKATILKTVHNRGIQPGNTIEETFSERKLKSPGVVAVTCDRHDFMENWFYVVDSPYFAITDENGHFTIKDIPPGHYQLTAWHPVLGIQKQAITIKPHGKPQINFDFVKN